MAMLNASGYTKIAEVLKAAHQETEDCMDASVVIDNVAWRLADLFAHDSKNFDRQRFYNDVGISIPMEEDQNGKRTS